MREGCENYKYSHRIYRKVIIWNSFWKKIKQKTKTACAFANQNPVILKVIIFIDNCEFSLQNHYFDKAKIIP